MEEVLDDAVQMRIDVHVAYIGQELPCYRLYVNDELFSERKYKFESDTYLSEQLFVKKQPGDYKIHVESQCDFKYKLRNLRCAYGEVQITGNDKFKINKPRWWST